MKITKHTILIEDIPIHYWVAGAGEPVILIHGLSGSSRWWRRNVPALATQYRVYLVDLPGFGAMRHLSSTFQLVECAAWLDTWMQALELETAHLVGHSMGGYICMALAVLRPAIIKHLVLVDSIGVSFGLPISRLRSMALRSIYRTTPIFWPYMAYDFLRAGNTMVMRAAGQILALDAASMIAAVTAPTLLIWGSEDDLVPLTLGRQLHARLSGSRLLILKGSNHFSMFDQPFAFNKALLAFLKGHEVGELYR